MKERGYVEINNACSTASGILSRVNMGATVTVTLVLYFREATWLFPSSGLYSEVSPERAALAVNEIIGKFVMVF